MISQTHLFTLGRTERLVSEAPSNVRTEGGNACMHGSDLEAVLPGCGLIKPWAAWQTMVDGVPAPRCRGSGSPWTGHGHFATGSHLTRGIRRDAGGQAHPGDPF